MKRGGIFYATAMVLVVLGLLCLGCTRSAPPAQEATFAGPTPTSGFAGPMIVSARASIAPCKKADLSFSISGRVKQIMVTEGQSVQAGQELAKLEAPGLEHAVTRAEAALKGVQAELAKAQAGPRSEQIMVAETGEAAARANVKVAEITVETAQGDLTDAQANLDTAKKAVGTARKDVTDAQAAVDPVQAIVQSAGAKLAQSESRAKEAEGEVRTATALLVQARSRLEAARAQADQFEAEAALLKAGARAEDVAIAESAVTAAEADLAAARDNLVGSTVTAPFAGVVGAVLINEGEAVSSQAPAFRLGDTTRLCIQTQDLSEANITRVHLGQEAAVRVGALPGQLFAARVTKVAPMATERQGDRVYAVVLELDPAALDDIRWGMNAIVEIAAE